MEKVKHLDRTIMSQEFRIRTSLVQGTQPVNQYSGSTSQPLGYARLPFANFFRTCSSFVQCSAHNLMNLCLTQCVILERHSSLASIDFRCEHIVETKLSGKDVSHDLHCLLVIISLGEAIEYICPVS
jgi:hypothetical protein